MSKPKPSQTTNRLHFEDLSDARFEDLCHRLVYQTYKFKKPLNHFGRQGKEKGIDIRAIDEEGRLWVIQCKRYKQINKSQIREAIDTPLEEETPPYAFLLIVACDVSRSKLEDYESYAKGKGITEPILWDASHIESKLYTDSPDLLEVFFGFSVYSNSKKQEYEKLIAMKEKIIDLFNKLKHRNNLRPIPCTKVELNTQKIVIRSTVRDDYPSFNSQGDINEAWVVPFVDYYDVGQDVVLK